jgi:hypothetical protein
MACAYAYFSWGAEAGRGRQGRMGEIGSMGPGIDMGREGQSADRAEQRAQKGSMRLAELKLSDVIFTPFSELLFPC